MDILYWKDQVTRLEKELAQAIAIAKEVLKECAQPPYSDSDLSSLISTLNARATATLRELEGE